MLLALTQLPGARPAQLIAPMLVFVAAALCHSLVATTGESFFDWIGVILLVMGVALAVALFVLPGFVLPIFPNSAVPAIPSPTSTPISMLSRLLQS